MDSLNYNTARRLRFVGLVILALVLVLDLFSSHKPHFAEYGFTLDALPWFYPMLGFLSTVLLVVVAKSLGILLCRKDHYYVSD
ncbi:MAG: hypothetical protein IT464_10845 [Planctomycetes bacterium]|nr:hypothetical protein [Planctomycetota bacterium]